MSTSILLHVCCGPCATHAIETLRTSYSVTLFFSNSNIASQSEYDLRLQQARKLVGIYGVLMIEDSYDHNAWLEHVKGLEAEPEQGRRCERCFVFSLARAANRLHEQGFEGFTTSLTVSPHKRTETIFSIGTRHPCFVPVDFKQDNGFQRSVALSSQYGMYRQSFCGCEFSRRAAAGSDGNAGR